MSAWPQAVWIVKKLQENFDTSAEIQNFNTNINNLNTRVNGVTQAFNQLQNTVDTSFLSGQVVTIASVSTPSTSNVKNGAIWFHVRS